MIKQSREKLGFAFRTDEPELQLENWSFRVYPHGQYPIFKQGDELVTAELSNYSLIPHWSKERRPKFATYNARLETLAEKPTWREPLMSSHCLVPLTSFFESCYQGSHAGHVVKFSAAQESPEPDAPRRTLFAAGLSSHWMDPQTGEVIGSFALITKDPSAFIQQVGHDRTPLFLSLSAGLEWLQQKPLTASIACEYLARHAVDPELTVEIDRPLKAGWDKA